MKKLFLSAIILASFSGIAHAASSDEYGIYVSPRIGASILNIGKHNFVDTSAKWTGHLDSKSKGVVAGGIALGFDVYPLFALPFRAELDFTARDRAKADPKFSNSNTHGKTNTRLNTLMLNLYYDINIDGSPVVPYVTAGLGSAFIKHKVSHPDNINYMSSESKTKFAWSAGLGANYEFLKDWRLDFLVRYVDAGKVKSHFHGMTDAPFYRTDSKVKAVDMLLGVRYTF